MRHLMVVRPWLRDVAVLLALVLTASLSAQPIAAPEKTLTNAGVPGGLCVIVGDGSAAAPLARTGRYLVHVLGTDAASVDSARKQAAEAKLEGLASAELIGKDGKLPYTENLVNSIVISDRAIASVALSEVARVLTPGGVVLVSETAAKSIDRSAMGLDEVPAGAAAPGWKCFKKPWPSTMDQWSHPRHAADGNAVSRDEQVGLPQRIRWVSGPQQEISNFVTSGGRAYFAGVLARDGFNGLRLWDTKLTPSPARGGFDTKLGSAVQPIATQDALIVWSNNKLQALDSATGRNLRDYPAGAPTEVMVEGRTILSIQKDAVSALDVQTAKILWKVDAPGVRCVAAGDGMIFFVEGDPKKPDETTLLCRDLADGKLKWQRKSLEWLPKVKRCTYWGGFIACEISTLNDDKPGNIVQMLSAGDGQHLWSREFIPGSAHKKQARVLFIGGLAWVLESKKLVGLDPRTGDERKTLLAANVHCFPPVATTRYLFSGEMDLTDMESGKVIANQITKQACSRDAGVVPANGLLYTFPKHCICWPMLRDFAALAPAKASDPIDWENLRFVPEPGPARAPANAAIENPATQWPAYRHDPLRSSSTAGVIPRDLKVLWTANLGDRAADGAIAQDWLDNYFIRGPVGPPVAANGMVFITRPDAHQVVALDAGSGTAKWSFTANGRVDTAPTIHRGLCLFGCKSGWVYCLRADDGQVVWRLRAAPSEERIIAYGQLESPWPVPGSVLVVDDVAYFAAGRQPLADGGILVFAVEPASGKVHWMQRLNTVPQKNFYGSSGLEFDNFDLLQLEGDSVAMSRWLFERKTGKMILKWKSGFAEIAGNAGSVSFPRGSWSYAPRNEAEQCKERPYLRPLVVFRDNVLFGCSQDRKTVYRRDFKTEDGEKFKDEWFAGWATYKGAREGGFLWRSQRLAENAAWTTAPFEAGKIKDSVSAMILTGQTLCVASAKGSLAIMDTKTGQVTTQLEIPTPAWDGLATADGRVFLTTQDGKVVGLGGK